MRVIRIPPWVGFSLAWGGIILLAEDDLRTFRHEMEHLRQQREDGLALWTWRYLTSPPLRLRYEALAWATEGDQGSLEAFALDLSTFYRCGPLAACEAALRATQQTSCAPH